MASVSSSAAKSLLRNSKSAVNLLLRARTTNITETVRNNGLAIRSLLQFNKTPANNHYPVYSEPFSIMNSGLRVGFIQPVEFSERIVKMEERDDDNAFTDDSTDYEDLEVDDVDYDYDEVEDLDEDDDVDEEEEEDKYTRTKKK